MRAWGLPQHLEDLSLAFVRLTHVEPKPGNKGDKGMYAYDAKTWLDAGFTEETMKQAYKRGKGHYKIVHLGALFREAQDIRAESSQAAARPIVIYEPVFN